MDCRRIKGIAAGSTEMASVLSRGGELKLIWAEQHRFIGCQAIKEMF
jgi:hypothetical protein